MLQVGTLGNSETLHSEVGMLQVETATMHQCVFDPQALNASNHPD